jgi:hypothetical protein
MSGKKRSLGHLGWLFALLYFVLFVSLGLYTWWLGTLMGLLHGLFLKTR